MKMLDQGIIDVSKASLRKTFFSGNLSNGQNFDSLEKNFETDVSDDIFQVLYPKMKQ